MERVDSPWRLPRSARNEGLRRCADTSSHPLVALIALYQTDFESHLVSNPTYYEKLIAKWESHTYWEAFRDSHTSPPTSTGYGWRMLLVFICGALIGFAIRSTWLTRQNSASSASDELHKLSLRERKIFSLTQEGKSNKEIAELTHVEGNTIKSHLRNIYAKLGISSRREAVDFPLQSKEE